MIPIRQKLKQHMMDQVYLETYDQVDEIIIPIVHRDITTPLFHVTYKQLFIIIHRHLQEYIKDNNETEGTWNESEGSVSKG